MNLDLFQRAALICGLHIIPTLIRLNPFMRTSPHPTLYVHFYYWFAYSACDLEYIHSKNANFSKLSKINHLSENRENRQLMSYKRSYILSRTLLNVVPNSCLTGTKMTR